MTSSRSTAAATVRFVEFGSRISRSPDARYPPGPTSELGRSPGRAHSGCRYFAASRTCAIAVARVARRRAGEAAGGRERDRVGQVVRREAQLAPPRLHAGSVALGAGSAASVPGTTPRKDAGPPRPPSPTASRSWTSPRSNEERRAPAARKRPSGMRGAQQCTTTGPGQPGHDGTELLLDDRLPPPRTARPNPLAVGSAPCSTAGTDGSSSCTITGAPGTRAATSATCADRPSASDCARSRRAPASTTARSPRAALEGGRERPRPDGLHLERPGVAGRRRRRARRGRARGTRGPGAGRCPSAARAASRPA